MMTLQEDFATFSLPAAAETEQITSWLRSAGLDTFELTAGEQLFRVVLDKVTEAPVTSDVPLSTIAHDDTVPVRASYFGVLSLSAPMRDTPLATPGQPVSAGDTVALLTIGPLQINVISPCDGIVKEVLCVEGELTGYGTTILTLTPASS